MTITEKIIKIFISILEALPGFVLLTTGIVLIGWVFIAMLLIP